MSKNLCEITQDDIAAKYMKTAKYSVKQAKSVIRVLSTIWNTVAFHFIGEDRKRLPTNPIPEAIRMMGGLQRKKTKRNVIPLHKLGEWVYLLEARIADPRIPLGKKSYLGSILLSLFLGLRSQESRTLRWDRVDLTMNFVTIEAGIAKNRRQHLMPLPVYVKDLLHRMEKKRGKKNPFAFPAKRVKNRSYQPIYP